MQKGFVSTWLIVGLVVAALVGGGYWIYRTQVQTNRVSHDQYGMPIFSPSKAPEGNKPTPDTKLLKDETANWKTYENVKYGFSIKYPEDAVMRDTFDPRDNKPTSYLVDIKLETKSGSYAWPVLSLEVFDNPQLLNAKDYFVKGRQPSQDDTKMHDGPPSPEVVKEEQVRIWNVEFYTVTLNPHNGPITKNTYIPKMNKMFKFNFDIDSGNDSQVQEHTQTFNQIISTFKFN